ncbi:MAG: penicillin acylase family protein, partial [Pseudomonadota bacterium]
MTGRSSWPRRGLIAAVTAAVALSVSAYLWLQSTLPNYARELSAPGLTNVVRVERDHLGVPHIQAQNFIDASFAMGYVQAQDRLWQMETMRRAIYGRNAELLG